MLNDVLLVFAEGTQEVFSLPLQVCTKVQASYETLPFVEMLVFFLTQSALKPKDLRNALSDTKCHVKAALSLPMQISEMMR